MDTKDVKDDNFYLFIDKASKRWGVIYTMDQGLFDIILSSGLTNGSGYSIAGNSNYIYALNRFSFYSALVAGLYPVILVHTYLKKHGLETRFQQFLTQILTE